MLSSPRNERLLRLIELATAAEPVSGIADCRSCSGGCIHRAEIVELLDGRRFFVKSGQGAEQMFQQEATGLAALAAAGAMRVPQVIAQGKLADDEDCLILEAIEIGPRPRGFFEEFGVAFAKLHRHSQANQFGWPSHNFLGSSPQLNDFMDDWPTFFAEMRLAPQLNMARNRGLGSRELFRLGEKLISILAGLIGQPAEPACLLHGDLWSGNFLSDGSGHPVLFDPAVYYGRREADLAMPLLFGGFPHEFFEAYHGQWPLREGWRERVEIYKLYHLLNHLNLFGSGYLDSCLEILRRFS